jgi:murein DD-endopeptidase MepM/ murein hydrolase activator NlpD
MRDEGAPPPAERAPLDEAFERFLSTARQVRRETPVGAPMPEAQARNWEQLLDSLDPRLGPRAPTALLSRVRLQLEAEFEADAAAFGDVPEALAQRVAARLRRLTQRLASRASRQRQVDPTRFLWPVDPVVVSSPYGVRVHPIAGEHRFHAGVDLEAPRAHPVLASESGVVTFSAWNGAHGKQVELQHDAHWVTRYSHLDSLLVKPGARVRRGQVIGLVGQTGLATGPHLHFELRRDGDALDPEAFLRLPGESPALVSELAP